MSSWRLYTYEVLHDGAWIRQQHLTGPMSAYLRPGLFRGPGYRNLQVRRLDPANAADWRIIDEAKQ